MRKEKEENNPSPTAKWNTMHGVCPYIRLHTDKKSFLQEASVITATTSAKGLRHINSMRAKYINAQRNQGGAANLLRNAP